MKTLSIVIVNWNSGNQLRECLESIRDCRKDSFDLIAVVVVDNNSADNSMQQLPVDLPLKIISNDQNKGFGFACNQGARESAADFILFLNPDALLHMESLEIPIMFLNAPANSGVGICGVQLIDEHKHVARSCTRFPTPSGMLLHSVGFDRIRPRLGHFMTEWDHLSSKQVDHVIGAFFLMRRGVFDEVGGFDERFFVYLEDLDVSYEAYKRGWQTFFLAEASAFHAGGGTSRQIKARRLFYAIRSRLLYSYKHFSLTWATVILLATLLVEPFSRVLMGILHRSPATIRETFGAYRMLTGWAYARLLKRIEK